MQRKTKLYLAAGMLSALCLAVVIAWAVHAIRQTEVSVDVDDRIHVTPEVIESIEAIGEWEFLSVSDEELVDTVRKGIFTDDHLARIYYGTVRIGIDMHQTKPGWLQAEGDSLVAVLPPVGLLDQDFIDEARTKSFHESGRWSAEDREALFRRAHRQMLKRCLTQENIERARKNGEAQFRQVMQSMGFRHVIVRW